MVDVVTAEVNSVILVVNSAQYKSIGKSGSRGTMLARLKDGGMDLCNWD
jgi:hypothetical protein